MLGGAAKGSPVHELKDQRVSPVISLPTSLSLKGRTGSVVVTVWNTITNNVFV